MQKYEYLFSKNSYDTNKNHQRAVWDKLLFDSRLYFYICNFWTFILTGRTAKQGKLDMEQQTAYSNRNIHLIEDCGGQIHIRNLSNVDKRDNQPVVLIGNHMSLLETAIFHAILRPRLDFTFVIKESLLDVPFFGHIMRAFNAIPVTRANPKEDFKQVLTRGKACLESGKSIIIFPQSTRSTEFIPENFNSIGVKLAKSAGVKIVPFALKTDFLANGKYLRDIGPVNRKKQIWFEFGEPMEIKGNGKEELQQIIEFIEDRLNTWRAAEAE